MSDQQVSIGVGAGVGAGKRMAGGPHSRLAPYVSANDDDEGLVKRFRLLPGLLALAACTPVSTIPPVTLPFAADTARAEIIAPGVVHRYIRSSVGPWAIHALDVDLSRCYSAVAVKGATGAPGRRKASDLLTDLSRSREVVGGVNADFFTLAGFQGVPTGGLISAGHVIVGPSAQPLFSVDSS